MQQTELPGRVLGDNEEVSVLDPDPRGLPADQEFMGEDPCAQAEATGAAHHPGWRLPLDSYYSSLLFSGTFCNL